jgi:hypothetical protein
MIGARRFTGAALALVIVTSAAAAQQRGLGGMGGFGRGRGIGNTDREPALVIPKYVNAVNLLIEHRQDLALTDTQFVQVVALKRALDSANVPLSRRLDSLQRLFKGRGPLFGEPSAARRDSLASARAVVQETIGSVRDNVSATRDKLYTLLSFSQRSKAQELEDKAEKAIEDETKRAGRGRAG